MAFFNSAGQLVYGAIIGVDLSHSAIETGLPVCDPALIFGLGLGHFAVGIA